MHRKVPNTSATAASAGTDLNGAAEADACAQIIGRLRSVAGGLLGCDPDGVVFECGVVSGGGTELPFARICEAAYHQRIPHFAHGYYRTPGIYFDAAAGRGRPFHYYPFGAAVSEVEVDGFTGAYRLLRSDILQDVGDSISPVVDRGQVEGGFLQGVGWLTLEELLWGRAGPARDRRRVHLQATLVVGGADIFNVDLLQGGPQPTVIFGSKAVGEPPLMLAISVREALRDAVSAFAAVRVPSAQPGAITFDGPATPERIFFAVRQAPTGSSSGPVTAR